MNAPRTHLQIRRPSAESLRWVMGLFFTFLGSLMLITPHRFAGTLYEALRPYRFEWGIAALASGVALLAVAILRPRRWIGLAVHGLAGATLVALAASFAAIGMWTGAVSYSVLGVGLGLAGLLPLERTSGVGPNDSNGGPDLFAMLMGIVALISGVALLAFPSLFASPYFDPARPWLGGLGAALLAGGTLLLRVHLWPAGPALTWTAHLAAGASFATLGLAIALPRQSWTGLALNWGCGVALAVLPWLSGRLALMDTAALRSRLALALATATSVALVLTAAVATSQEERLASEQVLEMRQIEAQSVAQNVADYVELNAARAAALAATAAHGPADPTAQRRFLATALPLYPGMTALARIGPDGSPAAVAGDLPLDRAGWLELATAPRGGDSRGGRGGRVVVELLPVPGEELPRLVFSAPVVGTDGRPEGALVGVVDAGALAERISRPGSNVFLGDGHGRMVARRMGSPVPSPRALPAGWDRQVARGRPVAELGPFAGFAPVPDLGWAVAVERPRRAALAGVRRGREMAFLLLLGVVPLAIVAGIVTARWIARPLGTLADAVGELTAGNPGAPLAASDISEVARLAAAFTEMRDRLAERNREGERLAAELRARAEALADSDRRKDEFLAMLAHELRNPLGAIANAAYVLVQTCPAEPPFDRVVPVIERQIQHLARLVDDLLDVSRITRGKVGLRRARIDLGDIVRHAVDTVRPLVEAKRHSLRLDLPAAPLPLEADATRLEQVMGNLLRNAAKYTDPGGSIEVAVERRGGEAVVHVRDDGIGIAPELLPRVFDLFTQGEQGLDRAGAGLGIGLTLVRSLVEMHGGRVEARSDGPGQGTELEVRLPLSIPSPTPPP